MPTGTVELVIGLQDDTGRIYPRDRDDDPLAFRGPVVAGPHAEYFAIDSVATLRVAGIHFKPGGAFPFLGGPAGQRQNPRVSLGDLGGSRAAASSRLPSRTTSANSRAVAGGRTCLPLRRIPITRGCQNPS